MIKTCQCEDFPCCGHAETAEMHAPEWCDVCGGYHGPGRCPESGYDDEPWEDDDDE